MSSQLSLLGLSCIAMASLPPFFIYIKVMHWHNDYLITGVHDACMAVTGHLMLFPLICMDMLMLMHMGMLTDQHQQVTALA